MTIFANPFKPADWYWIKADGTTIYASGRNRLVYTYDSGYLAFVAKNGAATPWPIDVNGQQTTAALAAVLSFYGITISIS